MRPPISIRLVRPGLQRRIMLYVIVGLALMFGALAILDLGAISRATDLVYQERLTTAYTTAGIFDRDFARVAGDALETAQESGVLAAPVRPGAAADLLDHLDRTDPYAFFSASGVWLLDGTGNLLDQAGFPRPDVAAGETGSGPLAARLRSIAAGLHGAYAVSEAVAPVAGAIPFALIAVRLGSSGDATAPIAVINTVSDNSTSDFVPAWYGSPNAAAGASSAGASSAAAYHLEVVDPAGIAILGIGADEQPGQPSPHFPVIGTLMASGGAAAQLHEPGPGDTFAPHVMAVVPLAQTPFYVVLEQPVDVALALPIELRNQLLLTTGLGFIAVARRRLGHDATRGQADGGADGRSRADGRWRSRQPDRRQRPGRDRTPRREPRGDARAAAGGDGGGRADQSRARAPGRRADEPPRPAAAARRSPPRRRSAAASRASSTTRRRRRWRPCRSRSTGRVTRSRARPRRRSSA